MKSHALADFVNEEMQRRNMTLREFAKLTGVSHSSLHRITQEREQYHPGWDIVVKLAKGTNTDIRTLAAIIAPDAVTGQDASAIVLVERIKRLTPEQQEIIDGFIAGKVFKQSHN